VAHAAADDLDGRQIMEESRRRHDIHPFVFERQSFIMTDSKGNRTVRQARKYWRLEPGGGFRFLLVFDQPPEVHGVAMLAVREAGGEAMGGAYLPALGPVLKTSGEQEADANVIGTDFSIADLSPEDLDTYDYQRRDDLMVEDTAYFIVDARPRDSAIPHGYSRRRHYIRQDNFFIERTDYFDRDRRLVKRRTRHGLKTMKDGSCQPDMILMENLRERHSTLIQVLQRIYSESYVPRELFRAETLFANRHMDPLAAWAVRRATGDRQ
jgi:hypothetical protein